MPGRSASPIALPKTTLIRNVYRSLIRTGRAYAAFTDREKRLVSAVRDKGVSELLDPMSGYGLLTQYCAEVGISSYCLELNRPQYLWQLLCHPRSTESYRRAIDMLEAARLRWPRSPVRAAVSTQWFPDESKAMLEQLLDHATRAVAQCFVPSADASQLALALIAPFAGRLSCCVSGSNLGVHTKQGGICVYHNWEDDYCAYLGALRHRLSAISRQAVSRDHTTVWGDARTFDLPPRRFKGMVTSPPYPNRHDYSTMFQVEQAFLDWAAPTQTSPSSHVIGTNFTSGRNMRVPSAPSARQFLDAVVGQARGAQADYHDRVYYRPYYALYFTDIEEAYRNVSHALHEQFEGYVTVVNNAHRELVVPVAEVVMEVWQSLGFHASVVETTETFHVGTRNPRARGRKARHTEYVVKVTR